MASVSFLWAAAHLSAPTETRPARSNPQKARRERGFWILDFGFWIAWFPVFLLSLFLPMSSVFRALSAEDGASALLTGSAEDGASALLTGSAEDGASALLTSVF